MAKRKWETEISYFIGYVSTQKSIIHESGNFDDLKEAKRHKKQNNLCGDIYKKITKTYCGKLAEKKKKAV